jgi:hypothetical protein
MGGVFIGILIAAGIILIIFFIFSIYAKYNL